MQRIFKCCVIQNIILTPDKELNILIYRTPSRKAFYISKYQKGQSLGWATAPPLPQMTPLDGWTDGGGRTAAAVCLSVLLASPSLITVSAAAGVCTLTMLHGDTTAGSL